VWKTVIERLKYKTTGKCKPVVKKVNTKNWRILFFTGAPLLECGYNDRGEIKQKNPLYK